jgi:hypothetical protein
MRSYEWNPNRTWPDEAIPQLPRSLDDADPYAVERWMFSVIRQVADAEAPGEDVYSWMIQENAATGGNDLRFRFEFRGAEVVGVVIEPGASLRT